MDDLGFGSWSFDDYIEGFGFLERSALSERRTFCV